MLLTQKQQKHLTGKFDKYECLTSKEILPTNQRQIKEQDEFKCSPLGKTFWKQKKKRLKIKGKNNQRDFDQ